MTTTLRWPTHKTHELLFAVPCNPDTHEMKASRINGWWTVRFNDEELKWFFLLNGQDEAAEAVGEKGEDE